jgi:uncharacterized protein YecE (DUF72 family)
MPSSRQTARSGTEQSTLFELPPVELAAAAPAPEHLGWAAALPREVRLGTMSWAYPGWRGLVYGPDAAEAALAQHGLGAYAQHPLLGAVEIDRSYYEPLGAHVLRAYAEQVPAGFRFLVKAHEDCTVQRYPLHARYGSKRGELNPLYLDAGYAAEAVVGPVQSAFGSRLGALLFQFSPSAQPQAAERFAAELGSFLSRLPRGVSYAVELRTPELLGVPYAEALAHGGAVHCHNAWSGMPDILTQARQLPPAARNPLVIRWLLAPGEVYADARDRFRPFSRITREDPPVRSAIARLVVKAAARGVPALVLINNKAEGCAPESAFRLAQAIVQARGAPSGSALRA